MSIQGNTGVNPIRPQRSLEFAIWHLFEIEFVYVSGCLSEIILSHALEKLLLRSLAPLSGGLCGGWTLPFSWSYGVRRTRGPWKQIQRPPLAASMPVS